MQWLTAWTAQVAAVCWPVAVVAPLLGSLYHGTARFVGEPMRRLSSAQRQPRSGPPPPAPRPPAPATPTSIARARSRRRPAVAGLSFWRGPAVAGLSFIDARQALRGGCASAWRSGRFACRSVGAARAVCLGWHCVACSVWRVASADRAIVCRGWRCVLCIVWRAVACFGQRHVIHCQNFRASRADGISPAHHSFAKQRSWVHGAYHNLPLRVSHPKIYLA